MHNKGGKMKSILCLLILFFADAKRHQAQKALLRTSTTTGGKACAALTDPELEALCRPILPEILGPGWSPEKWHTDGLQTKVTFLKKETKGGEPNNACSDDPCTSTENNYQECCCTSWCKTAMSFALEGLEVAEKEALKVQKFSSSMNLLRFMKSADVDATMQNQNEDVRVKLAHAVATCSTFPNSDRKDQSPFVIDCDTKCKNAIIDVTSVKPQISSINCRPAFGGKIVGCDIDEMTGDNVLAFWNEIDENNEGSGTPKRDGTWVEALANGIVLGGCLDS